MSKEELKKNPEKEIKQEPVEKKVSKKAEEKKKKKRVSKKKEQKKESPSNISAGVNLIPTLSEEEVQVEENKRRLNVGSVVSLIMVLLVSLGIIGFNIITKAQLNAAKDELYTMENDMLGNSQKVLDNQEILERAVLYKEIQKEAFSPKEVIEYINDIVSKSGDNSAVENFVFGTDLEFTFSGTANDLEEVSKLWYLLTHDENIETISLNSVGKGIVGVKFSFEGKMLFDEFLILDNE